MLPCPPTHSLCLSLSLSPTHTHTHTQQFILSLDTNRYDTSCARLSKARCQPDIRKRDFGKTDSAVEALATDRKVPGSKPVNEGEKKSAFFVLLVIVGVGRWHSQLVIERSQVRFRQLSIFFGRTCHLRNCDEKQWIELKWPQLSCQG